MPVLRRTINEVRAQSLEGTMPPSSPNILKWLGLGSETAAGEDVTPDNTLEVIALYSAITLIASGVGWLPILFVRLEGNQFEPQRPRRLRAFLEQLNPHDTPMVFKESMTGSATSWDN